ncbi:cobyrinate a,c-diamide synthase [Desertibacillus haloalkaliphilus]|uniref:cobyrinate a,c-diamide synthase n=1 Tax=Desertibacillus haloalkaliphilus TaxID=1328930 RepID=UPI001C27FE47|nr:cobyrinate a,c-diamide synthase [Desertibacillus haloalkaliphilus]MBU8907816.1 cobyrinate a,c-diamide synthase [Desertibacillus haloalkaliphilus]
MQPRIVIAGTGSGVGKTTLTVGLLAALKKQGLVVQGFKCGPDYIDPSYHTAVTGRYSRNLDSWMLDEEVVKEIFVDASRGADVSIIEGVMGFYDGKSPKSNIGSTAEISSLLDAPVILVVNIASMARSAAAIVKGYQLLDETVNVAGVILNQAGSEGHYQLCKTAIEQECHVPVLGFLERGDVPAIPERHLGLIPAIERGELDSFFDQLGAVIAKRVDLEAFVRIANQSPDIESTGNLLTAATKQTKEVKIAIAQDAAFNFYYQENLKLLEGAGATLVYFSPLAGESLPKDVDGLYIGGGFPEEFADELSQHVDVKREIKESIKAGLPTLAECGGYMFLAESITTTSGDTYPMVGVVPGVVEMQERLAALGYRDVTANHETVILKKGEQARGHEFHYSTFSSKQEFPAVYEVKALRGTKQEGYYLPNLVAGYTHLHFASNPNMANHFVEACLNFRGTNHG